MSGRTSSPTVEASRTGSGVDVSRTRAGVASVSSLNLALTGISLDLTRRARSSWIADGYTVALAALVLPFSALGDHFGRRTLLLVGTVVFGLAALIASTAQTGSALSAVGSVRSRRGDDHAWHGRRSRPCSPASSAIRPSCGRLRQLRVRFSVCSCGLILEWGSWRATFVALRSRRGAFAAALVFFPEHGRSRGGMIDIGLPVVRARSCAGSSGSSMAEAGWTGTNALAGLTVAAIRSWSSSAGSCGHRVRCSTSGSSHCAASVRDARLTVQFLCLFAVLPRRAPVPATDPRHRHCTALCLLPMRRS